MRRRTWIWLAVTLTGTILAPGGARAQETPASSAASQVEAAPRDAPGARRVYTTRRAEPASPHLDGIPDDACWTHVPWSGDFVQWNPTEGAPPTEQTAFKIVYDDDALYVAFRASDRHPERIVDRLARRDNFPGDWVEINIDSRHDYRTAYSFTTSVSGTRGDEFISKDGNSWDSNWDPIWEASTHVDDQGWTAEIRIPLSQLRFSSAPEQVWGIQVMRRLFREEERSVWQRKRKDEPGWVSRFGELRGLRDLRPRRQIELLPYSVLRGERFEQVRGDPFLDGASGDASFGLDGKIGLRDLTLDFTVNPDFGQVEADPSEVNLTAFETFFSERRPFFIEGNNILDFQISPSIAGGGFTRDNLFYSRRIGRRPRGSVDLADGEYAEIPDNTSIGAALKLSGKTESGWSLGILESITTPEDARIDRNGRLRSQEVEPLANYLVARLQRDLDRGNTRFGGMLTSTVRNIDTPELAFLHRSAWAGGFDAVHQWDDKSWYVALNGVASHVRGEPEALLETQTSSARYFQRPDNHQADLDSSRTSLSGHGGSFRLGRSQGAGMRFETGVSWRSPGFEINDLGFMRRSDRINQFTWAGWASRNPFAVFRRVGINFNQWLTWDSGGHPLSQEVNGNFNVNFLNNWSSGAGVTRSFESISNTALRGGPSSRWPGA